MQYTLAYGQHLSKISQMMAYNHHPDKRALDRPTITFTCT